MIPGSKPLAPQGRDNRVDFYRGIALTMIFVNHIPGTLWENFTSRNFGFSDSAELFVFLAGFASAYAYGRAFLAGSPLIASIKAWRRAGVLYLVHILLTMIAIAMFGWAMYAFGDGNFLKNNGLITLVTTPIETLIGIVTLGHQFGYVNILPMYSVILLMLPVMLYLARIDRRLMLGCSLAFWLACGVWRIDIPAYPLPGGWFFNPLAWQVIFAIGLYCGLNKVERGYSVRYVPALYAAALAYLVVSFVYVQWDMWWVQGTLNLPFLLWQFDKTYVTAPRLLHVLALVYVFANAPKSSPLASIGKDNLFAMLGRHSLPVFAVGTVLSLLGQLMKFGHPDSLFRDTAIVLAGLAIQFALARYLEWWKTVSVPAKQGGAPMLPASGTQARPPRITPAVRARL